MGLDQDANNSSFQLVLELSLNGTAEETPTLCLKPTPMNPSYPLNFNTATASNPEAEPSLTLGLQQFLDQKVSNKNKNDGSRVFCGEEEYYYPLEKLSRQTSPHSDGVVSSFSCGRVVKRERDVSCGEIEVEAAAETAADRVSSRVISDEEEDGSSGRKKLRLTKDQSALLEESFKQHSTLNPKQKQALARQLNLRARQVEVWFQNRRARTKLKQTEVDCEFLKKCCETLTDENRRLKKELQEMKALKQLSQPPPLYMAMPAATLTMCPSCERLGGVNDHINGSNKIPKFTIAPAKSLFFSPFTNPSAAC